MKFTQNRCSITLASTKSAKARSELTPMLSLSISPVTPSIVLVVLFFAVADAEGGGRSLVCMRREAVRTNWPTAALKPARKALNGYIKLISTGN
jgi:hypothetical protein